MGFSSKSRKELFSRMNNTQFHFTQMLPSKETRIQKPRFPRNSAALVQAMNQMATAILAIPGDYNARLSTASAISERNALDSAQWDNPPQIKALLREHPTLAITVAQAMRGLAFEFGSAPFRLRADDNYLILAVQTFGEVGESVEKLEAFSRTFWKSRSDELLLALTIDFLAPNETPHE